MRSPSTILASPVARAARSLQRIQQTRDACGKWPATQAEMLRASTGLLASRNPRDAKPSERARVREKVASVRAFRATQLAAGVRVR